MLKLIFRICIKIIFPALLTVHCLSAFSDNQKILCPSITFIKQTYEKDPIQYNTVSHLSTKSPATSEVENLVIVSSYGREPTWYDESSDLTWGIMIITTGDDFNSGYAAGIETLKQITHPWETYADLASDDNYICHYDSTTHGIVMAYSDGLKNEDRYDLNTKRKTWDKLPEIPRI